MIDFRAAYTTTQPDLLPADPVDVRKVQDVVDAMTLKRWRDKADARYLQQLHDWQALADVRHTPAEVEAIVADQSQGLRIHRDTL